MKRLIIVTITLLGICSTSFAQGKLKVAKQKQQEEILRMKKEYQLKQKQAPQPATTGGARPEIDAIKQN